MDSFVSCSELRLYEISKKFWLKSFILGESQIYSRGLAMHSIVENGFKVSEEQKKTLDYNSLRALKKLSKTISDYGQLCSAVFVRDEKLCLKGIADGMLNGIPVEIKFNSYRKEDETQALAYALLYGKERAYLCYPSQCHELFLSPEKSEELRNKIIQVHGLRKMLLEMDDNNVGSD